MDASIFKLTSLDRLKGPLGYPGGKTRLAPKIIEHLPKGTYRTFVEPFFGSGSVTFALPEGKAKRFVANDIDPQLMGFWKGFTCPKLESCVIHNKPTIANRRKFTKRFRAGSTDTCDYYMARRLSFNSNGKDVNLSDTVKNVGKSAVKNCASVKARLSKMKLSSDDFRKVLRENDKPGTVMFLDPPYEGRAKGLYKFEEGTSPQEVCAAIKGLRHARVLVTHYNTAEVRSACKGLSMRTIAHKYVSRNRNHGEVHRVRELLLANYPL